jgi:large conductance mechanosensitive channel
MPFSQLQFVLSQTGPDVVAIRYGQFLQHIFDFIIIAFAIFMLVRALNKMQKPAAALEAPPPPLTKEQELLTEIRNLLQQRA